ncbi:MAG: response regulator, partial [Phycisphaerales bacterium]|nr:response regulator [Phycisphaerales bacterium]
AGGVAHDFNNLLVGMLGNASLARKALAPDSPAQDSLSRIEDAAMHASGLTNQMLAYSGKGRFLIESVDLSSLVLDMMRLIEVSISKRARVQFELDDRLPSVEGDASQLRQVVMNLLTNASDALMDMVGEIRIRTSRLTLTEERLKSMLHGAGAQPGEFVVLEVTDSGVGMDEETRTRIFDPFFTTKFTGRGLGLAATMGVVRAHNGAIEVRSTPGNGTTFRAAFPVTPSVAIMDPVERRRPVTDVAPGRVLVVDDERVVREMIEATLEHEGYTPVACADGPSAIQRFREDPQAFQAVLLDVTLPTMSGGEVLRRLREVDPSISVLLMSGFVESDVLSRIDFDE